MSLEFPVTYPVTDLPPIEFFEQALTRLLTQYSESENLKALIEVFCQEADELQQAFQDTLNLTQLDAPAQGDQLTQIGNIVGQDRFDIAIGLSGYFGFVDLPLGYIGFYDIDGGDWLPDDGSYMIPITDEQYRAFIRAKIYKNQSIFSLPAMEQLAQYVMLDAGAFATEPAPLLTDVCFSRTLEPWEIALLYTIFSTETNQRIIPPPAGTDIEFCYYPNGRPFGPVDLGYYGFADIDGGEWNVPLGVF